MKSLILSISFTLLTVSIAPGQTVISGEDLQKDLVILKQALQELHPGLYKHATEAEIERAFEQLKQKLSRDQEMIDVYREISLFTAKIQCGHTYGNFWNQVAALRDRFVNAPNKVPFTFRIIDEQAFIYQNLSESEAVKAGDRIMAIDGKPMSGLLSELKAFVKADGSNDAKRLFDLQVFGVDNFEAFDIYLPLVLNLEQEIELELEAFETREKKKVTLELTTRKDRFARLQKKYGKQIESYDDYWNFKMLSEQVAYLQLGTFVTWKMKLNWKKFLEDAFAQLSDAQVPNLIIDIRGNEGGNADVQEDLYKRLRWKNASQGPFQQTLRTNFVRESLRPHVETWSEKNYDVRSRTVPLADGFYTFSKNGLIAGEQKARKNAYQGKVYLLADASNSSGTFFLIHYLKKNGLATIVGETSGGNQQGITGGQIFYLRLPNSKVEVDIPVIGYYPPGPKPDAGITPDIEVKRTVKDLVEGTDAVLETVLELISKSG